MIPVAGPIDRIRHFARLERILAVVCIAAPVLMILGDGRPVRDSISAYYNMAKRAKNFRLKKIQTLSIIESEDWGFPVGIWPRWKHRGLMLSRESISVPILRAAPGRSCRTSFPGPQRPGFPDQAAAF